MSDEQQNIYILSEEQKRFYADNGYLVIKGLIDFTTLYNLKKRFQQICRGLVEKGNMLVFKEPSLAAKGLKGEDLINKVSEIQYDEVFMTFMEHPILVHLLSQFIGPEMNVMNTMFINKPPGSTRHPPHQDLYYFPFRPADKIIAAWTAIDDVTIENGCLYIVPGSHKKNIIYEHGNLPDSHKLYHGILDAGPCEPKVLLEMSPGDTVFFHPLIVHGSGENRTKNYRKSITAHYASSSCHCVDVRGTVQDGLAKELEQEAKRRGFDISFEDSNKLYHGVLDPRPGAPKVFSEMSPGDTALSHPLIVHGSERIGLRISSNSE